MTNREWFNKLSNKEFAKYLMCYNPETDEYFVQTKSGIERFECNEYDKALNAVIEWLQAERKGKRNDK